MRTTVSRLRAKAAREILARTDEHHFERRSKKKLLRAFKRASKLVPGYARHLARCGVDPTRIDSLEQFFESVPYLDKETVFANQSGLSDWCIGGSFADISSVWCSSGYSRQFFSFGVETFAERASSRSKIEFFLEMLFKALSKRTMIINCAPMGVRLPLLQIPVADTSVRSDAVLALIDKLSGEFEQFVIAGEAMFLKKVVEEGVDSGLDWGALRINLVTGAEFIPESYRRYMAQQLQLDLDDPGSAKIIINMGLSELGLSVFFENDSTVKIRAKADKDPLFRKTLCGSEEKVCPEIFQYLPTSFYLETTRGTNGADSLVVTTLEENHPLPLVRYKTGDRARLFQYGEFCALLKDMDLEHCAPRLRLPVALVWGRGDFIGEGKDNGLTPEEVKSAIFEEPMVASLLTGNFTLEMADRGSVLLRLQLRPQKKSGKTKKILLAKLDPSGTRGLTIQLVPYQRFDAGMELNYERKFQYIAKQPLNLQKSTNVLLP